MPENPTTTASIDECLATSRYPRSWSRRLHDIWQHVILPLSLGWTLTSLSRRASCSLGDGIGCLYCQHLKRALCTSSLAIGVIHQPMRPSVAVRLEGKGPLYAPLP